MHSVTPHYHPMRQVMAKSPNLQLRKTKTGQVSCPRSHDLCQLGPLGSRHQDVLRFVRSNACEKYKREREWNWAERTFRLESHQAP